MRVVALEEHFTAPALAHHIDPGAISRRGFRPRKAPKRRTRSHSGRDRRAEPAVVVEADRFGHVRPHRERGAGSRYRVLEPEASMRTRTSPRRPVGWLQDGKIAFWFMGVPFLQDAIAQRTSVEDHCGSIAFELYGLSIGADQERVVFFG